MERSKERAEKKAKELKREGLKRELKSDLNKAFKGHSLNESEPWPVGSCSWLNYYFQKAAGILKLTISIHVSVAKLLLLHRLWAWYVWYLQHHVSV